MEKWDVIRKKPTKLIDMFTGYHATKSIIYAAFQNSGVGSKYVHFVHPVISPSFAFLGDLRWVARFGLMSQIGKSQIEAPIGSLFQKYVSSTFMVKMRIDLGS